MVFQSGTDNSLKMKKSFHIPLEIIPALLISLAIVFITLILALHRTDNVYVYPMDDPYIHMAISRNLAENGVWGVQKETFSYSTSSILYPLLLALTIRIFGPEEIIPFVLNLIFGFILLWVLSDILYKIGMKKLESSVFLLVMALLIPIPVMMFICMEHVIQILITVLLVWYAARSLSRSPENLRFSKTWSIYVIAFIAVSVRFEALFITAAIGVVMLLNRRYIETLILGISGFLPLAIMGVISIQKGYKFLPNPLLVKGRSPGLSLREVFNWAYGLISLLKKHPDFIIMLVFLAVFSLICTYRSRNLKHLSIILNAIVFGTIIIHLLLGRIGWYIRYEAYLYALFLLSTALFYHYSVKAIWKVGGLFSRSAFIVMMLVMVASMSIRSYIGVAAGPVASENIYDQAYQVGRFLAENYDNQAVVCHDIGTIGFYANVKIVDLLGLSDPEAKDRQKEHETSDGIRKMAVEGDAVIAVCYADWFDLPDEWIKVGDWEIRSSPVTSGESVISFFALKEEDVDRLAANLKNWDLPAGCKSIVFDERDQDITTQKEEFFGEKTVLDVLRTFQSLKNTLKLW